jgi:3-dehydroquinate dehydratase-1
MGGVDETRRIRIIHHALTLGFAYIDIEYETYTTHQFVLPPRTKLVISAHIFTHTPPEVELQDLIGRMGDFDPAVIKIATMVKGEADLQHIYTLLKKHRHTPSHPQLLLIGMGEQGRETRIQGPLLGCPWTYASTPFGSTAPGQLSLAEMQQIYTQM